MFKYIRNRIHRAVMARLNLALSPIQDNVSLLKSNQELYHVQITQMLKSIGEHIQPGLFEAISSIGENKPISVGNVIISPNYGQLLRPDDVFLVSYPRSGNTWMRTIIAYILYKFDILNTLKDIHIYVPDLYYDLPHHNQYSQPRVLKTHEPYFSRQGTGIDNLYNRFIYVIRHPYKVLESYYDFEAYHHPNNFMPIGEFVECVMHNAYHFGGWGEHVKSWRYRANNAQSLFIRYEDLQQLPIVHIQRIAQFLGKPIDEVQAEQINQLSNQESMRELESKDPHLANYEIIRQGDERKTKQKLDDMMKERIYTFCKTQMDDFGYLVDGTVAKEYPVKELYQIP